MSIALPRSIAGHRATLAFPVEPPHGFADAVIELLETERFRPQLTERLLDRFDVISYFACSHFGLLLAASVASCALSR